MSALKLAWYEWKKREIERSIRKTPALALVPKVVEELAQIEKRIAELKEEK